MKNPCEKCLILPMCVDACKPLVVYVDKCFDVPGSNSSYPWNLTTWLADFEIRPAVLIRYNIKRREYKNGKSM